jgi:hypothetical protein
MFQIPLLKATSNPRVEIRIGVARARVCSMLSSEPTVEPKKRAKISTRSIPRERLVNRKMTETVNAIMPVM